ncbi:MarR family transcriptional regulator [Streptomyces sp. NPDC085942]|uniref:MarR family transcriptional regulator n=1 Tax=Streptomyces sp. NPDC085942 TaxID=3365743 RepID=UPI0037D90E13
MLRRHGQLVNTTTGEVQELWEAEKEGSPRRNYSLGGRYGQFSLERVSAMLRHDSGITGDAFRVFWYCAIETYNEGGATAAKAAKHLGLTPQATRRIAKQLAENRIFLVADVVGRTIKYKASPHIVTSLTGVEQAEEAAAYHLPTLPGRRTGAKRRA